MNGGGTRVVIASEQLSLELGARWEQVVPAPPAELGGGVHLRHPSGVLLSLRCGEIGEFDGPDLVAEFEKYADVCWSGPRTISRWRVGSLEGISGTFEHAMPGVVVREWWITNRELLANPATFATERQWRGEGLLADCEALVRTIRFDVAAR